MWLQALEAWRFAHSFKRLGVTLLTLRLFSFVNYSRCFSHIPDPGGSPQTLPHLSTNSGHNCAPGETGLTAVLLWLAATTLLSSCFHPHSTLDLAALVTLAKEDAKGLLQVSGASGPGGAAGFLHSLSKGPYSVLVYSDRPAG